MTDTNYKQLWRRGQDANKELSALLLKASEQIKGQAELVRQIRDGEISLEDFKNATEGSQHE